MTWAKVSDDFADDCWTLTDAAFRTHVEALTWNGRKLLDCRLPKDDVPRFAKHPEAVAELVATGWWTDDGDAYVIRHHADYQRTREQVLAQQEANHRNGRRGGRPRKRPPAPETPTAETHSLSESVSESVCESVTTQAACAAEPPPLSVTETHSLTETETERDRTGEPKNLELRTKNTPSSADADGAFDDFWQSYPRKIGKLNARKAWTRATRRTSPDVIMAGLLRHLPIFAGQELRFVPHPTTWLNAERWDDVTPAQAPDPPLPSFWNDVTRPRLVGEQT